MNITILHGHIGRIDELREIGAKNTKLVSFSVATSEFRNRERETSWHQCKAFAGRAELIDKYFGKGSEILVRGRYKLEQWTAKDGQKRSKMVLIVDEVDFCGKKGESNSRSDGPSSQADGLTGDDNTRPPPSDGAPPPGDDDGQAGGLVDGPEDDLPF